MIRLHPLPAADTPLADRWDGTWARAEQGFLEAQSRLLAGREVATISPPCVDCGEHNITCACVRAGDEI